MNIMPMHMESNETGELIVRTQKGEEKHIFVGEVYCKRDLWVRIIQDISLCDVRSLTGFCLVLHGLEIVKKE